MVGDRHAFGLSSRENVALVEERMAVDEAQFLDEIGAHRLAIEPEAGDRLAALPLGFEMCPQAVCRPAVTRRVVGGSVAEGRAEEVACKPAEMRRGILRHSEIFANPRRLVQHRDSSPVALYDEFGDHTVEQFEPRLDALSFDFDVTHRQALLGCDLVSAECNLHNPSGSRRERRGGEFGTIISFIDCWKSLCSISKLEVWEGLSRIDKKPRFLAVRPPEVKD